MRIALVNDVPMAIAAMTRVLEQDKRHVVAWVATNGQEAVERCAQDVPELLLMDIIMPQLDGVGATRAIMAHSPCAILLVTSTVEGNAGRVFEALGAGALDVVKTPVLGADGLGHGAAAFLAKIELLGRLTRARGSGVPPTGPALTREFAPRQQLVAIGSSAGGPAALAEVLGKLPANFPAAIVIIQHVDAQFAPLMAQWLHERSGVPVRAAISGDRPRPGTALLAGTNDHLVFTSSQELSYTRQPLVYSYRPSADVFFESVASHWKGEVAGVLLTGMGRDGAKGLKTLRDHGALTIAQDRATCVVYGMPKAAVELGAAVEVLPLPDIAPRLLRQFPPATRSFYPL